MMVTCEKKKKNRQQYGTHCYVFKAVTSMSHPSARYPPTTPNPVPHLEPGRVHPAFRPNMFPEIPGSLCPHVLDESGKPNKTKNKERERTRKATRTGCFRFTATFYYTER